MTFGPDEASGARVTSLSDYNSCLDLLQQEGYTEIDTARVYVGGKQEGWSKEAKWQERGLSIATKCYPTGNPWSHEPEVLRRSLEESLKELGTDCVDIFYLHAADRNVPFEKTLEECHKMFKEGKFVKLGLSNFTAYEVAEVVMTCRQHGWVR
jgi:aflatoxin B1 aldehyde reductase